MGRQEKEEGGGRKRNIYPRIYAVNIKRPGGGRREGRERRPYRGEEVAGVHDGATAG